MNRPNRASQTGRKGVAAGPTSAQSRRAGPRARCSTALPWLGGLAAGLLLIVPHGAVAASFDCSRARTPLEHLVCKDLSLSRLDGEMGKVLRRRMVELPPEQRPPFLAMHRRWLRFRLLTCDLSLDAPPSAVETKTAARCMRSQYELHLQTLQRACNIDKKNTLEDFSKRQKTYSSQSIYYVAQSTIPLGFSIIGGLRFYQVEWPRAPEYILPSTKLPENRNIDSYLRAEYPWLRHNSSTMVALCSVRSPQGMVWLVNGNVDGSLGYVLTKDVAQQTNR